MDEPENYKPSRRNHRGEPDRTTDGLAFKIAAGIILGLGTLWMVREIVYRYRVSAAMEQLNQKMAIAVQESRAQSAEFDQRAARSRYEAKHANDALPLPTNYRCIGKQLLRRLPNGWEQITDGSAPRYCK